MFFSSSLVLGLRGYASLSSFRAAASCFQFFAGCQEVAVVMPEYPDRNPGTQILSLQRLGARVPARTRTRAKPKLIGPRDGRVLLVLPAMGSPYLIPVRSALWAPVLHRLPSAELFGIVMYCRSL